MKKLVLCAAVAIFILSYNSCTKDKVADVNCTQTDTVNTYTLSVKPIFDLYCAYSNCHDADTHEQDIRLDTYEDAVAAAKSKPNFFCVIDHSCLPHMPESPPSPISKLPDSLITKIQLWRDNCYAE